MQLKFTSIVCIDFTVTYNGTDISQVINADPMNDDAKMRLAEIHEANGHTRKALELVYQGKYVALYQYTNFSQLESDRFAQEKVRSY